MEYEQMLQVSRLLVEANQAEKRGNPSRAKQLHKRAQEIINERRGPGDPATDRNP